MKVVPYHGNPGNACALACYTMVAQYLYPEDDISFERIGKLSGWRPGYVVWGSPFWKWLMDKGAYVTDYDVIDYGAWITQGAEGLKQSLAPEEFKWIAENTYSLEDVQKQLSLSFDHPHFKYVKRRVTWDDVVDEFQKPGICDLTLNLQALNHQSGFVSHRVVLIDVSDSEVVFHDPNFDNSGAYRHEPLAHFKEVFESIEGPELCRYSLAT